jgi:Fuc2NAc and GlcNAc transferase
MTSSWFLVVIAAFVIAIVTTGIMRRFALQRNLMDVPNERSSHASPTPRGGGVGIVIAFFAAAVLLAVLGLVDAKILGALLIGGGLMALVGFIDDRWQLRATVRFSVHLAAALLVVILLGGIPEAALLRWGLHGTWIGAFIAVLVLVWTANLFNFMDGIDGIAGSEAVFVSGAGALLNWHQGGPPGLTAAMLCLAAASLGFLRWNWPPAGIFMGDVGSGFLGFTLAALGLAANQVGTIPFEAWGILGGFFFVDATITLLRRAVRGDQWFEAHRIHAYQQLTRRWKAHLPVTLSVSAINLTWLLPWAWLAVRTPASAKYFLIAALAPLVVFVILAGAGRKKELERPAV